MSKLYDRLQLKAEELIEKYGKPIYIGIRNRENDRALPGSFGSQVREWKIDESYITSPAYAVQVSHRIEDRQNPNIVASDRILLVQSKVEVTVGDKVAFDSSNTFVINGKDIDGPVSSTGNLAPEFQIVNVEQIKPGLINMLYRIAIRR